MHTYITVEYKYKLACKRFFSPKYKEIQLHAKSTGNTYKQARLLVKTSIFQRSPLTSTTVTRRMSTGSGVKSLFISVRALKGMGCPQKKISF